MKQTKISVSGISLPFDREDEDFFSAAAKKLGQCRINLSGAQFAISKKSVDARKREDIRCVASVIITLPDDRKIKENLLEKCSAKLISDEEMKPVVSSIPMSARPLIVGMGPAGLFSALLLAENGYSPIIIDRGGDIADRARCVDNFNNFGILDTECNIQFGAGGAGTFSDGKLLTRINDPRCNYVLDRLAEFGAPEDIKIKAKPHIGTDILRVVVDNILKRIEELGGTVIYRCRYLSHTETNNGITVKTTKGEFFCGALILALGNSSRDTFTQLLETGFDIQAKPISVGVRIEHLKEDIDRALYGDKAGHPKLGAGEYTLSDTTGERGVYTFCMCPGGKVVAAASEEGGVVVNGMSERARDGKNSNCAVAVSVRCEDYVPINGSTILGAIEFQRNIERRAYLAGGSDYRAPIQTVGDFIDGKTGTEPSRIIPTYMDGKCACADLDGVFPDFITDNLKRGILSFDKKLKGFACRDAVMTAAETRTSAPVRILRGEDMRALGHSLIYPCGEGSGYAGGITSASVDGIRTALAIMSSFGPADDE